MNIKPKDRDKYHLLPLHQIDARRQGIDYYFTGKSCKSGHISIRNSKSGSCYDCTLSNNTKNYERYNISPPIDDRIQLLIERQNNLCSICGVRLGKDFHVDHCHKTGLIRGILCGLCNRGLGCFKDNLNSLQSAIRYLEQLPTGLRYKKRRQIL